MAFAEVRNWRFIQSFYHLYFVSFVIVNNFLRNQTSFILRVFLILILFFFCAGLIILPLYSGLPRADQVIDTSSLLKERKQRNSSLHLYNWTLYLFVFSDRFIGSSVFSNSSWEEKSDIIDKYCRDILNIGGKHSC